MNGLILIFKQTATKYVSVFFKQTLQKFTLIYKKRECYTT